MDASPSPPHEGTAPPPPDRGLVALKWLVIALTATMIGGIVILVWVFVARFPQPAPAPDLPASLSLPQGATPAAFTRGRDFLAVVTQAGEILIFAPDGGAPIQRIAVETVAD